MTSIKKRAMAQIMRDLADQLDAEAQSIELAAARVERETKGLPPQWTLGQLIDALDKVSAASVITFPDGARASYIGSYRGDYSQLALGTNNPSAWFYFLENLRNADGNIFEGYKGNSYIMTRDTPVWRADWGESDGWPVVGVDVRDGVCVILTGERE